jgi:hypothetical protein
MRKSKRLRLFTDVLSGRLAGDILLLAGPPARPTG